MLLSVICNFRLVFAQIRATLSIITTLPVPSHIYRRVYVCLSCKIALQNIFHDRNWNITQLPQIRACLSLRYYLWQGTVSDVLTKTWTVWCLEQIRTSVEPVSVTMLLSVICNFLLVFAQIRATLSIITTLPVPSRIYRRVYVCLSCKIALQNSFHDRNWNLTQLPQIRACLSLRYYLWQGTVSDVLTKTWTVWCLEQIRTSVERVSVTMLLSVICNFLLVFAQIRATLSIITTLPVPSHIYRRVYVCLSCKIALQNSFHHRNWNLTQLPQIRACLSLRYYLWQGTVSDVLTKTWTVWCLEQIRTSVERVSVTMLLSVICNFLLVFAQIRATLSIITTLPVPSHIYRRVYVCLSCKIALQNSFHHRNWNLTQLPQIRACLSLRYYLWQGTVSDVLTKTWTVWCLEQIRTSVEPVSVTMLLSVICNFILLSVITTLPLAWYI